MPTRPPGCSSSVVMGSEPTDGTLVHEKFTKQRGRAIPRCFRPPLESTWRFAASCTDEDRSLRLEKQSTYAVISPPLSHTHGWMRGRTLDTDSGSPWDTESRSGTDITMPSPGRNVRWMPSCLSKTMVRAFLLEPDSAYSWGQGTNGGLPLMSYEYEIIRLSLATGGKMECEKPESSRTESAVMGLMSDSQVLCRHRGGASLGQLEFPSMQPFTAHADCSSALLGSAGGGPPPSTSMLLRTVWSDSEKLALPVGVGQTNGSFMKGISSGGPHLMVPTCEMHLMALSVTRKRSSNVLCSITSYRLTQHLGEITSKGQAREHRTERPCHVVARVDAWQRGSSATSKSAMPFRLCGSTVTCEFVKTGRLL
mmetsp:Transcript_97422/g.308987  ORF Transcript_97422/g.308987 Transcript_97422/m.308987 type:complete len:367 (-) Transcript_97422:226-1326(-)